MRKRAAVHPCFSSDSRASLKSSGDLCIFGSHRIPPYKKVHHTHDSSKRDRDTLIIQECISVRGLPFRGGRRRFIAAPPPSIKAMYGSDIAPTFHPLRCLGGCPNPPLCAEPRHYWGSAIYNHLAAQLTVVLKLMIRSYHLHTLM